MPDVANLLLFVDIAAREVTLFACVGFLIGGIDDIAIDLLYVVHTVRMRLRGSQTAPRLLSDLTPAPHTLLAIFIPAWDEAAVIGTMLRTALARTTHREYVIYVGAYPNDRATIDAVAAVAGEDDRVRLVITDRPGPTTKADCLNAIWRAMLRDEAHGAPRADAIVLHDAEDLIDSAELCLHARMIARYDLVQVPVLPIIDRGSRFIAGHYADEFAEAHAKQLPVRTMLGAGMPLAGVGCSIRREMLEKVADARGAEPFDRESLTEDYELGLTVKRLGGAAAFARFRQQAGGPLIATRELFPGKLDAAVRQKTRWMIGIALAGWDRVGWGPVRDWRDHWMRMRDRRALLGILVLAAAYLAIVANALSWIAHRAMGIATVPVGDARHALLLSTFAILCWRVTVRAIFVQRAYGTGEALLSIPRALVGNTIALLAARRAVFRYIAMLRGTEVSWDKTSHRFPDLSEGEAQ